MTTPRCWRSSPAPTSPAASTPATPPRCGGPARWRREHGVVVGAQVGYRDLAGFGRRFIDMDPVELADDVLYQIGALEALARAAGTRVRYVKPHGALYNAVVHHEEQARAVVDARAGLRPDAAGARAARLACCSTRPSAPGSARSARRSPTGPTRPRARWSRAASSGAVLHDPDEVARRVVQMVTEGTRDRGRRHDRARSRPSRSACTATRPGAVAMADAGPRAGCSPPGSTWGPSRDQPAGDRAALRRPRAPRRARRHRAGGRLRRRAAAPTRRPAVADVVPAAETVLVVAREGASVDRAARRAGGRRAGRRRRSTPGDGRGRRDPGAVRRPRPAPTWRG